MLVYSSYLVLGPAGGVQQVIDSIAKWMGQRSKGFVDPAALARGLPKKRLRDGSTAVSRATKYVEGGPHYPFQFSAELSHRDDQVAGRRWTTGIGLRQVNADAPVECTFLLKTDEASARVLAPIQVTRPRIVLDVVNQCNPLNGTVGTRVKQLDESSAAAFLAEVERVDRSHPIVVISALRDGSYLVQPERLRQLLVGIADVVLIPASVNTFEIEKVLGRRYGAWGGAVNVLSRFKARNPGGCCDNSLYMPDRLRDLAEAGVNLDSEILSAVTHQTNVPTSWRHISMDVVAQAILRGELEDAISQAKQSDGGTGYLPLLESAMDQLSEKDKIIEGLREDVQERDDHILELDSSVQGLKFSLAGRRQAVVNSDDDELHAVLPIREGVSALLTGEPTLEQSLTVIRTLFPERIVVLDSALESARESEAFRFGRKGFDLLWKLASGYWPAVANGGGDAEGRKVFGQNAYAQNEAGALSNEGKRRRTFEYKGQDILMEKHLKIGVKDSVAETLRVHFEWVAADRAIVIGHCGKHLDF